jgi:hypothetical protein
MDRKGDENYGGQDHDPDLAVNFHLLRTVLQLRDLNELYEAGAKERLHHRD